MTEERGNNQPLPRLEYKKILYTTDLSESGRHAFPYAASIAHRYGAQLTVLHAHEGIEFEKYLVGYMGDELWEEIKERNLQEARDILTSRRRDDAAIRQSVDTFCQESLDGSEQKPYVTYDVVVKMGEPVEVILEEVRSGDYDLVVIGKHGHMSVKDAIMGTTARRVIRRCNRPVLVVPLPED